MNFVIDIRWFVKNWYIKNCIRRTQLKEDLLLYITFIINLPMIHYFVDKKKVQFKYAHKLRDIIMSFKSNYKINNVSIIQLLILKKIFKI